MNLKHIGIKNPDHQEPHYYRNTGLALIGAGLVFVADRILQTGWLSLFVLPVLGALGIYYGVLIRRLAWAIPGAIVSGVGWGGFFLLINLIDLPENMRLGLLFVSLGLGFLAIFVISKMMEIAPAYWSLLPGITLAAVGGPFLIDQVAIFVFEIFVVTGLGIALWAWGSMQKLIGLIIPGCLLLGIGPGIYMAWSRGGDINGLTETGVMLVWFALGWGLITIAARVITQRFIWWPLIPGGLLAVVGWGLYIGGDPGNALSFIGNTGSIGLIIFGIYLLLLRRGFKG